MAVLEALMYEVLPEWAAPWAYTATQILIPGGSAAAIRSGVCFEAGTLVQTAEGLSPIEEIKPGDLVLARDEKTGEVAYRKVMRTFVTPDQQLYELEFKDASGKREKIGVTGEHPFWVKERGWVGAAELLPGDEVFTSTGGWVQVSSGTWLSARQTVYNLEVDGFHTYFVGEVGAWVHNACTASARMAVDASKGTISRKEALQPYYPPNRGFVGSPTGQTLRPGTIIDRYGGTGGSFASPQGTPIFELVGIRPGAQTKPLNTYKVVKPFEVDAGKAAPWFGQPGGGMQYDLGHPIQELIDSGHLKPL